MVIYVIVCRNSIWTFLLFVELRERCDVNIRDFRKCLLRHHICSACGHKSDIALKKNNNEVNYV